MKAIITLLALMYTVNSYAQKLYSDATIKNIRTLYSSINQLASATKPELFEFIDGSAYIDEKGDTIYEGEGEQRNISFYKNGNKIIRIVDQYLAYEGEARTRSVEYNLFNDSLIFVFVSQSAQSYVETEGKGFDLRMSEDRIYFKKLKPYYHLSKNYYGYTNELKDFSKDAKHEEVNLRGDDSYIESLNEIRDNYLKNNMKVYERVIEKLE
jgi:hypothetical protein